jgi:DHA3 family macrolide efflux protein-like MFS transporter
VKNKSAIFLLLTANMISGFTQGLNMIAIPWYFIHIVGEESLYGILFSGITFVTIFWTLYAGTLVDRFNRKHLFLSIDILGFLFIFSVGLMGYLQGGIHVFWVGAVFMFSIFVFNLHYPAVYAFTQEITESQYYGKINSWIEIQSQTATMLAGALAVFLLGGTSGKLRVVEDFFNIHVKPWNIYDIFMLDGATYLVAFILLLPMRFIPIQQRTINKESFAKRFKEGWKYLNNNPVITWFGTLSFSMFIATIVEGFFLAAIYVSDYLGEDAVLYTIIELGYSFGAVLAGVFIRRLFKKQHPILAIALIMIAVGLGSIGVAFTQSNGLFLAFNFLLGLSNAGVRILRVTYIFKLIPNDVIGRTNGLFGSYNTIMRGTLIAIFAMPFFSGGSNVVRSYGVVGLFLIISSVMLLYFTQSLKNKDTV